MSKSYYSLGSEEEVHRGKVTKTNVTSPEANNAIQALENSFAYDAGYIPAGFEHRPDNISELFYDTPAKEWLILLFNNIADPFEGLNVRDRILIPKL